MTKILSTFLALLTLITGWFSGWNFTVNYYVYEDVYYGVEDRQCLDITIPGNYKGDLGLVLFIHGGSWIHGDKSSRLSFAKNITKNYGYVSAAINYRYVNDDVDCFDILDDIDAALAEIKEVCSKKGINVNNVVLYGNSAGAHLALMYAYTRKNTAPITPTAVIALCAPTNLTEDALYYDTNLGTPKRMASLISDVCGYEFTVDQKDTRSVNKALLNASPINYVRANTVPTLIAHGMIDESIDFSNAVQLDEKLTKYGVKHDFVVYPNSGHQLENDPDMKAIRNQLITQYIKTYLGDSAFSSSVNLLARDSVDFPNEDSDFVTEPTTTVPSESTTEVLTTEPITETTTEVLTTEPISDQVTLIP